MIIWVYFRINFIVILLTMVMEKSRCKMQLEILSIFIRF